MMNIGMILDTAYPPDPRVENEAISLIESGHSVYLYCVDYSKRLDKSENIKQIRVKRQQFPNMIYYLSALAYTVPLYHHLIKRSIKKFLLENKIDIVHIHDIQVARAAYSVANKLRLKVILDLHENKPEIMKFYAHTSTFIGRNLIFPSQWKKFEFNFIAKATQVITVTEEAKQYYVENLPVDAAKFCVVPNFVRKEFYHEYQVKHEIIKKFAGDFPLLYIGDTGFRRGLTTVLHSLPHLIGQISNLKFIIVGRSKYDEILYRQVKEMHLEKYVSFEGWQHPETFQSYITASKIGICPFHRNIHHDTTYANKLFQFMSFGKPVVVSDCKAQADLVEHDGCGLVFRDRDAADFSDKILKLYKESRLYDRLSQNCTAAINEKFNWNIAGKSLIELYKRL